MHGEVEWVGEGAKAAAEARRLRVRAPFADGSSFGDALTGDVAPDRTFRLRGVMTGWHYFEIEGLPEPWALARVLVRGREPAIGPIEVHESEQLPNVRLMVSTTATELSGLISDAAGHPVADALILLRPPGAPQWSGGDPRYQMARSDASGRYRIRRLPAGAYKAAALIAVDELAAWRSEWLGPIDAQSQPFLLTDAAAPQRLDLVAISPQTLNVAGR